MGRLRDSLRLDSMLKNLWNMLIIKLIQSDLGGCLKS
jgi:hypothetical protein